MLTHLPHLLPLLLGFTLVDLPDDIRRKVREAIGQHDPSVDGASHVLSVNAAQGQNSYVRHPLPDGTPKQITVKDKHGKNLDFIYIGEVADGELRYSLEFVPDDLHNPLGGP